MILQAEKLSILAIIKEIVKNKDYLLVIAAFGSCCGLYAAYELLYSELYLNYFPVLIFFLLFITYFVIIYFLGI